MSAIENALTIDVEDYFQVAALATTGWAVFRSMVSAATSVELTA